MPHPPVEIVVASQTSQKIDAVKAAVDDVARLKVSVRTYASKAKLWQCVCQCLLFHLLQLSYALDRVLCAFCVHFVCTCVRVNCTTIGLTLHALMPTSTACVVTVMAPLPLNHVALGCHASTANDLHS
jgi:hypothetical protein